jgi:hypothetical protein
MDEATGRVGIPRSHADLFDARGPAVLTTLAPDRTPRSCLVACGRVAGVAHVDLSPHVTGATGDDPRVSLLVVDPLDTGRFIQIRGDLEILPGEPLTGRIRARRITLDAIHR